MGIYSDNVVPHIVNFACGMRTSQPMRRRVCDGLRGQVIEVGFGSGHNVPFYPEAVEHVAAVEPADLGWKLAKQRLELTSIPVERAGLDGQFLPFEDDTFDSALSTWTMCTIPDAGAALHEVSRVLKPGGTLHFVEHGLAPDESVQKWQRRLEPVNRRLLAGCHLTRQVTELLEGAGFTVTEIDTFYEDGAPKPFGAMSLGVVTAP